MKDHRGRARKDVVPCSLKELPESLWLDAARRACEVYPANAPCFVEMHAQVPALDPMHLAVLTKRYWGEKGVKLGVRFLDTGDSTLKSRILAHLNAWGERANVRFSESLQGEVRIARQRGDGYWSYLGTDLLSIAPGEATMNLDSFTNSTSEAEFRRVVRHEAGHTLGFPHEHMRPALIARLDRRKTLDYFQRSQGWDERTTMQQVLTPLEESALIATPADQQSIMCYQLPASITLDGRPILGGADINEQDRQLAARIYPLASAPPAETWEYRLIISEGGRKVEVRPV